MKYFVLGDASGWLNPLENALNKLDASFKDTYLPDDITVIHVGDLVRKGQDSDILVKLLNKMVNKYEERWVQLIGNHETHFLTSQKFGSWTMKDSSIQLLKQIYTQNHFRVAWHHNNTIITHAGITESFWEQIGCPATAAETASAVNMLTLEQVNHPGVMLGARGIPGPLWASSQSELYPSWQFTTSNFRQIHGHTSPYNYRNDTFWPGYKTEWFEKADRNNRHCFSNINGNEFVAVDPTLNERYKQSYAAFQL